MLYDFPEYGEMLGGYYFNSIFTPLLGNDVPVNQRHLGVLKVEDNTHPATRMFASSWPLTEEFYTFATAPWTASAPELNVMESMVTSSERNSVVIVEVLKVAVSPALTGAIPPTQFLPSFHVPSKGGGDGLPDAQTASSANAGAAVATNNRSAPRAVVKNP